jgi:hypothetical protein
VRGAATKEARARRASRGCMNPWCC